MTETVVTDEDILRAYESEQRKVDDDIELAISKQVMAAFKRAKKASKKQNARSCEIVAGLRRQREDADVVVAVREPVSCIQKTLFDFTR